MSTLLVYRQGADYITFASCFMPARDGVPSGAHHTYHFGTAPCTPDTVDEVARSIARQEASDFMRRKRKTSHYGDARPFLQSTSIDIADGALQKRIEPRRDVATVKVDSAKVASLPRAARKRIQDEIKALASGVEVPAGKAPLFDVDSIRGLMTELSPICEELLVDLRDQDWPPFGSHSEIDQWVAQRFTGDRRLASSLADALKGPERRPSTGRDLAIRVLATATGLGRDRLRALSRV
jgi:hypothetical protein